MNALQRPSRGRKPSRAHERPLGDPYARSTSVAEAQAPPAARVCSHEFQKVSEIASKGGKAAHAAGTAHQFSSDEARNAGRRGE